MADTPFVHLHLHSDFSLLDGACEIGKLVRTVAEQKMPAVALTDHGNLFGAVQFYNAAKHHGVEPILGCEVYVSQQGRLVRSESDRYNHLILLCENQDGYRNLIDLVSTAYLEGFYYKPRIDKDLLARHSKGLIALSACLKGDINETLLGDRYEDARRLAYQYTDLFGRGNFFLELQDHGLDQDKALLPQVVRLARDTGIPLVATNDAHYLHREDALSHDIMLCIQTGKTINDPSRMHWKTQDFYLKSRAEMMQLFGEVEEALDHTWEIAQRCRIKLEQVKEPFPKFEVPAEHTTDTYFEYVARNGFERRRPRLEALSAAGRLKHALPQYLERLDREIRMIEQMRFAGYFLIVWDFIRFSKLKGIPVGPGRGSAAGSLVSYAMGITDIDPLEYGLLFERFLNPERISMPDIDIDFCTRRRGEVIQYVTEKYGREQVAQIITIGTLGRAGRHQGRGPRAGDELQRGGPAHQDGSQRPQHLARGRPQDGAGLRRGGAEGRAGAAGAGRGAQAGRHGAQRGRARSGRGHFAAAAEGTGPALPHQQGRNRHPVRYERSREAGASQDGLSGADDADADPRRAGADREAPRGDAGHRGSAARRRADLPGLLEGLHQRHFPVRVLRHARHSAPLPAQPDRGPVRAERAVPARTHSGRHGRRLHRAQARPPRRDLRFSGVEGAPGGNLRRHRLPGAGDADRQPPGRVFARRGGHPAPRHGQEEGRGDGQAARAIPGRSAGAGAQQARRSRSCSS